MTDQPKIRGILGDGWTGQLKSGIILSNCKPTRWNKFKVRAATGVLALALKIFPDKDLSRTLTIMCLMAFNGMRMKEVPIEELMERVVPLDDDLKALKERFSAGSAKPTVH